MNAIKYICGYGHDVYDFTDRHSNVTNVLYKKAQYALKGNNKLVGKYIKVEFTYFSDKIDYEALNLIYILIGTINILDDSFADLQFIETGSLRSKITAIFGSKKSKEVTEEIIRDATKMAKGKMTKDYEESIKAKSEGERAEVEKELLKSQLEDSKSLMSQYERNLSLKLKELEIESKELENEKLRTEIFQHRITVLKELLSNSLINQEEFMLLAGNISMLKKKDGELKESRNFTFPEIEISIKDESNADNKRYT